MHRNQPATRWKTTKAMYRDILKQMHNSLAKNKTNETKAYSAVPDENGHV